MDIMDINEASAFLLNSKKFAWNYFRFPIKY